MVAFDSCQDLVGYARLELDRLLEKSYAQKGGMVFPGADMDNGSMVPESAQEDAADEGSGDSPKGGGGADHSQTNVQEAGVDEPDLVKTDGQRMYSLSRGVLRILDVRGEKATLTDRVDLGTEVRYRESSEMLLDGTKILIIDRFRNFASTPDKFRSGFQVTEIDASVPGQAKVLSRLDLEGQYVSARKTGSVVRLVFKTPPKDLELRPVYTFFENHVGEVQVGQADPGDVPMDQKSEDQERQLTNQNYEEMWAKAVQKARIHNRKVLAEMNEHHLLPRYRLTRPGTPVMEGLVYGCEQAMRPGVSAGVELLSVLSIDLKAGLKPSGGTGVVASGSTVYANASSLYVATRAWDPGVAMVSEGMSAGTAGELIEEAPASEPVSSEPVSSEQGRALELRQATPPGPGETSTRQTYLHKFDLSDPQQAIYKASGLVNGDLLNQFAMSEHQGVLRVAATRYLKQGWQPTDSFVATLQERDGHLEQMGQVGGLGKTEKIRSVRFMGDVGYVVTFRQTDPLYTLDLKNPAAPQMLGELKIEGFSAYLHPLSPGYLLGVGRDADQEGRIKGLQVSVFDVRDLTNPQRIHNYTMADAGTNVEFDHKAFLYWPKTKSVVLPVQGHKREAEDRYTHFAMALVLGVDPVAGIAKRAEITHPKQSAQDSGMDGFESWAPPIDRSLVIGDRLWTLSAVGAKAVRLDDATPADWMSFE